MNDASFFGYGSLVNRATHEFANCERATLTGWRRSWKQTHIRETPFLSVERCAGHTIEGLVALVRAADWEHLDKRESGYRRNVVTTHVGHELDQAGDIHVYEVKTELHRRSAGKNPILLSYIDVVVQGYLREFGHDGVARFFETTDGWDTPIKNDRAAPCYPRHQQLTATEVQLTDNWLDQISANVLMPDSTDR